MCEPMMDPRPFSTCRRARTHSCPQTYSAAPSPEPRARDAHHLGHRRRLGAARAAHVVARELRQGGPRLAEVQRLGQVGQVERVADLGARARDRGRLDRVLADLFVARREGRFVFACVCFVVSGALWRGLRGATGALCVLCVRSCETAKGRQQIKEQLPSNSKEAGLPPRTLPMSFRVIASPSSTMSTVRSHSPSGRRASHSCSSFSMTSPSSSC